MLVNRGRQRTCFFLLGLSLMPFMMSCAGEKGQNQSKNGPSDSPTSENTDAVRLDKAIAEQTEAIRANPKDANAYYTRGLSYDEKGEADKAIADFSEAIRLSDTRAYGNRAACYKKKKEYDKAIADYTEVVKSCQKSTNDPTAALFLASTAAHAHYNRGVCFDESGDHRKAMADYEEAIRIEPSLKGNEDLKKRMSK